MAVFRCALRAWLGRSVHGTAPLFFSLTKAQIHSWTGLGGRGPGNVAPEKLPVFLDLPRILVAPASRHKAPQSGLWLPLRHPVGTLKSRRLWL